jgi:hypothetical protein
MSSPAARASGEQGRLPLLSRGAGKANEPPLELRRSAGALAKAEGRRARRVSERGWGPASRHQGRLPLPSAVSRQGQRPSRGARKRAGVGPREH